MNTCWHVKIFSLPLKLKLYVRYDSIGLLKGHQPWIFIGRTDAGAEALAPDTKNQLIGKDAKAEKDWGQEDKGMTEDEMVGWPNSIDMSLSKLREIVKDREAWSAAVHRAPESDTTWQMNTTTTSEQLWQRNMQRLLSQGEGSNPICLALQLRNGSGLSTEITREQT